MTLTLIPYLKVVNYLTLRNYSHYILSIFEWDLHHNNLPTTINNPHNRNDNSVCRTKLPSYKYIPLYRTKSKKYFITSRYVPIRRDLPNKIKNIQNKKYTKEIPIRSIIINPPFHSTEAYYISINLILYKITVNSSQL